jgi:FdhE protein
MIANEALTSEQVKQAVRSIRSRKPAYVEIVDYYEKIFTTQEKSKTDIHIQPLALEKETVAIKNREHFPIITVSEFVIDKEAAAALFEQVCDLTLKAKTDMAMAAESAKRAVEAGELQPQALFAALLQGDDDVFDDAAENPGIDKEALAFLVYSALKPSLSVCAEQLATYLPKDASWTKGYCPICGSQAGMALLGTDGERWLCCGFCWHKWTTNRIFCPFCENTDSRTLHYFFSDAEQGYRVDVCDKCHKYIKTVDTRVTEYPIYPPLEQVSTLHLDMLARDKGLESGLNITFKA